MCLAWYAEQEVVLEKIGSRTVVVFALWFAISWWAGGKSLLKGFPNKGIEVGIDIN